MSIDLTRRALLLGLGAGGALAACGPPPRFAGNPFSLGVAAGDPLPGAAVIWTRLAPDPLIGGSMTPEPVAVDWLVAADERLQRVVAHGSALAHPDFAHSVHVDVEGLEPGRWYWYRFAAGGHQSPVGRMKTAPIGAALDRLRFAFASCAHWEHGYYTAYRHLAREDIDFVLFLGDYIYEYSSAGTPLAERRPRLQPPGLAKTLAEYRSLYALYKSDPDLQAAHAAAPWIVTWDDHEVENDYANDTGQERTPPAQFLQQRAAAYQAYWEHMPLRLAQRPSGPDARLYRRFEFGSLMQLSVADGRQFRSPLPCPRSPPAKNNARVIDVADCPEHLDEARSLLGPAQERWLLDGLARSQAQWNVIGQPVLMARVNQKPPPGRAIWTESWDAFPAARRRLLGFLAERPVANPIVLSGDIHSFWAADLRADFDAAGSPVVAAEFACTSITSDSAPHEMFARMLPHNPHIRFMEARRRGYALCTMDRRRWVTEFRAVSTVLAREAGVETIASFGVEAGKPGLA